MKILLRSVLPKIDRYTPRTIALLLIFIGSLIYGASAIVDGLNSQLLWPLGIFSMLLGWWIARGTLNNWGAALVGLFSGFGYVFWQIGRLGEPLLKFLASLINYFTLAIRLRSLPSTAGVNYYWEQFILGVIVLFNRLGIWVTSLFVNDQSYDPIVLAMVWGLAIWASVYWAAWSIRRNKQPFAASIPSLIILGYSLAYVNGDPLYLLPMLGSIILLSIFVNHDSRENEWKTNGDKFPQKLRRDVIFTSIIITSALMTIAAFSPSISADDIRDYYRKVTGQEESHSVNSRGLESGSGLGAGSLAARQSDRLTNARRGGLPRTHLIGSGPELSEQVVMVIRTKELQPTSSGITIELPNPEDGYYFRSLTYERFDGRGWYTFDINIEYYQPNELAVTTSLPGQHIVRQQINLAENNAGLIYVAGNLISVDQAYSAAWRPKLTTNLIPDIFGATIDSNSYIANSLLSTFSEDELRNADQTYPVEISKQYLQLPDVLSERVIALAFDLTATEPTAYDRAVAIETYLRTFEYDLDIPQPPLGKNIDIVDYFLFTLQRGYCDYYASSMVILARAAGLPARFVQGYIGGTYDSENNVYLITEDQAHSWVEIYFPDYGWIEFEPTAGRPAIERQAEKLPELPVELEIDAGFLGPLDEDFPPLELPAESPWQTLKDNLPYIAIGLVMLILLWPFIATWWLWLLPPSTVISKVFRRYYRYGRYIEVPMQSGKTPKEFAASFSERFTLLVKQNKNSEFLKSSRSDVKWIASEFAHFRYSSYQPNKELKTRAIQSWQKIRSALWAARWRAFRLRYRREETE